MEINTLAGPALLRRHLLVPTFRGAKGGLCPQAGFRRVDAAMATGHRTWSPPIT